MHYQDNKLKQLEETLINNSQIKQEEISTINKFKQIYNIIRTYEKQPLKYNDIITNSDIRYEFLMEAIRVVFEKEDIDENTRNIILQMYEDIYDYLYKDSELKEIEIPQEIIKNIFNKNIIPSTSELKFIFTLIKENKQIFESEIKDKYFSQCLEQGLHTGITKELKIEEENLSHLLGLTNDGSLYEFYRKKTLESEVIQILYSLGYKSFEDENYDYDKFNKIFKEKFGLDYNKENYIKIVNWRYNASDEYLQKRGIYVTEEEREILNQSYQFAPKSKTLNFYCKYDIANLLEEENNNIHNFIYEYIRKKIINLSFSKRGYNELKQFFSQQELNNIIDHNIDQKRIIPLLKRYLENGKYKLEEDSQFKNSFINTFGYTYPLINYYELLSKNISFYNFSLFKNLNSIIVDYDSFEKKIESDVFLVSYSEANITTIENNIIKLIDEKNKKYEKAINGDTSDITLDKNYLMNLISLFCFPEKDRYYFKYGFTSKEQQKQDERIIQENAPTSHNITLIGFKANQEEQKRLKELESKKRKRVKHYLNCETNITSNYYQYITDFIKNGIEYPIDILEERGELPYNRKRKILKIIKPLEKLYKYVMLFEFHSNNITFEYENNINYLKELGQKINKIINDYQRMTTLKISIMKYRIETQSINEQVYYKYKENLEKEITTANQRNKYFNKYQEYINNTINYYNQISKHKR